MVRTREEGDDAVVVEERKPRGEEVFEPLDRSGRLFFGFGKGRGVEDDAVVAVEGRFLQRQKIKGILFHDLTGGETVEGEVALHLGKGVV